MRHWRFTPALSQCRPLPISMRPCRVMVVSYGAVTRYFPLETCYFSHSARRTDPPPRKPSAELHPHLGFSIIMKVIKKQIRKIRSRIASRSSFPAPSDVPTTQPGELHTLPTQVQDTGSFPLKPQHGDSGAPWEHLDTHSPHAFTLQRLLKVPMFSSCSLAWSLMS